MKAGLHPSRHDAASERHAVSAGFPGPVIDVSALIEARAFGSYAVKLILVCWLVTFFDGYDMNVFAYAAPHLGPAYHLSKAMLGTVSSSATAGLLFGAALFGFVGDRIGRRAALIIATAAFGSLTLALMLASNYIAFMVLRFFGGIALGGAIPLTWALGTEYVPKRYRATAVTLIMLGYGIGVFAGGPISLVLIPRFGWMSLFTFGGAASLLAAGVLALTLPESLRFLVTTGRKPERLVRAVRRLAPERDVPAGARFVLSDEQRSPDDRVQRVRTPLQGLRALLRSVGALFEGRLRYVTLLLWTGYIASSMTTFFLAQWGVIVYEGLGFSTQSATWVTSGNSVAGATGGLLLMRLTDRLGVGSVAVFPAIAVPLLITAAFAHLTQGSFIVLFLTIGVFLSGSHYGVTSLTGLFYPTSHRALGTGWASSVAKLGSIAGPIIGGVVMQSGLRLQHIFAVMAVCPAILSLCMLGIATQQKRARREAAVVAAATG
jgi:MFS transporter, AAHS family, 4-hydroxybenzoate transporter